MSENQRIYIVGGSKGGVGKSMVSMALVDYLREAKRKVILVETDTSNPDVAKAYGPIMDVEVIDLDKKEGWIDLVDICGRSSDHAVVVNTAARNNDGVGRYGETLTATLPELERKLVTLWVINWQKDSLELLADYLQAVPDGVVHVFRNAYFGEDRKYERYNNSGVRKVVEGKGGKSLTFPDVADRVAEQLYSARMPIEVAAREMSIGNRAEMSRWRKKVGTVLSEVVDG